MSNRVALGKTGISVYPLCLGGNVFGWSANETESHSVLDAYASSGGNFIDTADMYSEWHDGNVGGESETIIGNWMKERSNRSEIIVATKVAKLSTRPGLRATNIIAAAEDSLRRLQTDYIDLYYAHEDDLSVPQEESLQAFTTLVEQGKVRHIGASNFEADRLQTAVNTSAAHGLASYEVVQPNYNLVDRSEYEGALATTALRNDIAVLPYYSLASGFLTGKYTRGASIDSVRAEDVLEMATEESWTILEHVISIAQELNTTPSAISLAWLRAQPGTVIPIASARTTEQLAEIMPIVHLSAQHIQTLNNL